MRHALDVESARLLIAMNAGRAKRWDAARIAEKEDNIFGMLLAQHDTRSEEKCNEQNFSKHSFAWISNLQAISTKK
jgi:hypothetical protein